jgi:polar amino acid transport system substrate-binding protein
MIKIISRCVWCNLRLHKEVFAMHSNLDRVRQELAPEGTIRVGLNLSNFLLINAGTGQSDPQGIVPDLARTLAAELGVQLQFVPYPSPGPLADAVDADAWDVAFLANEPARAAKIAFSPAYLEIPAGYLVPAGSPLQHIKEVDRAGVRVASMDTGAYTLYLQRTLEHAQLVLARSIDESFKIFVEQGLEALAGLQPRLLSDQARLAGSRILPGSFTAVQQAIGTPGRKQAAARWLADFARRIQTGGQVQQAIDRHRVPGVNVAPYRPEQ